MATSIVDIQKRLAAVLNPDSISVRDEGYQHVGHEGAKGGKQYFAVHIVSEKFIGKSLVERHRMVFEPLQDLMKNDIHALRINAKAPNEQ